MSWITLDNLRRFVDNLFHGTVSFDGSVTHNGADEFNGGVKVNTKPLEVNGGVKVNTTKAEFNAPVSFTGTTTYKGNEIATKADITGGGSNITVDSELSDTSTNPVQNRIIKRNLDDKWDVNSETLKIKTSQIYPLSIINTEDSQFRAGLGPTGMYINSAGGAIRLNPLRIEFKNKNSFMYIAPLLDGSDTVQISLTNIYGTITSTKNIATEDYVRVNYVPLSNGHISINGSELWVE